MITECWIQQSSHRDTFFSIYLVTSTNIIKLTVDVVKLLNVTIRRSTSEINRGEGDGTGTAGTINGEYNY